MNQPNLIPLRDVADQLILLAGTFQTKPYYLRAKQIRQADKSLCASSLFFTSALSVEAKQWKGAADGLQILRERLSAVEEKRKEIEQLELRIAEINVTIKLWSICEEEEKQKIIQNAERARDFINNNLEKTEAHILHRYKRFSDLKELAPYADKANYLCEAIFHYENKDKYEANITKITNRNAEAKERLKTVQRGFWLAMMFCIFIVTIPICLPFGFSLWKRKKDLKNQISNGEDTLKRDRKRLAAAEEGAIVEQNIRAHLGEMSLEQIRDTLSEVRDLRAEFQGPESTSSATAVLLSFIDLHKMKLSELFGEIPEDYVETFKWLAHHVEDYQSTESAVNALKERKEEAIAKKNHLTKGYSLEMLLSSIDKLDDIVQTTMLFPFDVENKKHFVEICMELPAILAQAREALFFASQNQSIDAQYWDFLRIKMQSFSNIMSLCVLTSEYMPASSSEADADTTADFSGENTDLNISHNQNPTPQPSDEVYA